MPSPKRNTDVARSFMRRHGQPGIGSPRRWSSRWRGGFAAVKRTWLIPSESFYAFVGTVA